MANIKNQSIGEKSVYDHLVETWNKEFIQKLPKNFKYSKEDKISLEKWTLKIDFINENKKDLTINITWIYTGIIKQEIQKNNSINMDLIGTDYNWEYILYDDNSFNTFRYLNNDEINALNKSNLPISNKFDEYQNHYSNNFEYAAYIAPKELVNKVLEEFPEIKVTPWHEEDFEKFVVFYYDKVSKTRSYPNIFQYLKSIQDKHTPNFKRWVFWPRTSEALEKIYPSNFSYPIEINQNEVNSNYLTNELEKNKKYNVNYNLNEKQKETLNKFYSNFSHIFWHFPTLKDFSIYISKNAYPKNESKNKNFWPITFKYLVKNIISKTTYTDEHINKILWRSNWIPKYKTEEQVISELQNLLKNVEKIDEELVFSKIGKTLNKWIRKEKRALDMKGKNQDYYKKHEKALKWYENALSNLDKRDHKALYWLSKKLHKFSKNIPNTYLAKWLFNRTDWKKESEFPLKHKPSTVVVKLVDWIYRVWLYWKDWLLKVATYASPWKESKPTVIKWTRLQPWEGSNGKKYLREELNISDSDWKKYDWAIMTFTVNIEWLNKFHFWDVTWYWASNWCIRLPLFYAKWFYDEIGKLSPDNVKIETNGLFRKS